MNRYDIASESSSVREKARNLSSLSFFWSKEPTTILIIHKDTDADFFENKVAELAKWLKGRPGTGTDTKIYVYPDQLHASEQLSSSGVIFLDEFQGTPSGIELVITLGGDGTVLLAAWLFQADPPPILPFHFGTLGFLTVFQWDSFQERIDKIFRTGSRFNSRMRINCKIFRGESPSAEAIEYNVLNEVVIERGASPHMCVLELYSEDQFLTTVQADGVAIATPTGSTAYSLSAGGSVIHPDVSAILVTPICPHSLSFRPLVIPDGALLKIIVAPTHSRSNVWVSFDGRARVELRPGDHLIIKTSVDPILTFCRDSPTTDWFHSLSKCLHWNAR